ncbi:MAG: hypothetical protein WC588_02255 [Candidatus Micrarchaeia archaeon]
MKTFHLRNKAANVIGIVAVSALAVFGLKHCEFQSNLNEIRALNKKHNIGMVDYDERIVARLMTRTEAHSDRISAKAALTLVSIAYRCTNLPEFEGTDVTFDYVAYTIMSNQDKIVFTGALDHNGKSDRGISALRTWQETHPISNLIEVYPDTARYQEDLKNAELGMDANIANAKTENDRRYAIQARTIMRLLNHELEGIEGNAAKYDLFRASFAHGD